MRIGQATNIEELISALDVERQYRMDLRKGQEKIWWDNILLVAGDHYSQWNAARGTVVDANSIPNAPRRPHSVRLVLNHALTTGRTEMSKLIKTRPVMEVIPATEESEDISAAKVGGQVLEAFEWKFKLRSVRKKAVWWMVNTGFAAVGVFWDPYDRKDGMAQFVIDPQTGRAVHNEVEKEELMNLYKQGQLDKEPIERIPLGDIKYKLFSPFQMLPTPTAEWWEDCTDMITIEPMHIDEAIAMFGRKVADIGPDEVTMGTMEKRALYRAGLARYKTPQVKDTIYVYTWWLLPGIYRHNKFLQNGCMVRWCKNGVKLDYTNPFPFLNQDGGGELPFAYLEHIPSAVSIWPESIMQHIRHPNLELDKTASQLLENKDYLCNPTWRRAAQHRMKKKPENIPGGEVVYQHVPNVPPPEPVPGIPLPSQVENILVYLRDQILDISGQGEVSRGRVPSGVRAGVMMEYLQEEDETRLAPTTENVEDFVAKMGKLSLERAQQFYELERLMRYPGPDGQLEAFKFKGADLANNTDVRCTPGSAFPKMKAAKQQFMIQMVEMGLETDAKRVKDVLELGGGEPDEIDLARAQAKRENAKLHSGEGLQTVPTPQGDPATNGDGTEILVLIPEQWHNDEVHLREHYAFMSTTEYEQIAAEDPSMDQRFKQHTTMHELNKLMKLQQQMMMTLAAKGAPTEMGAAMESSAGAEGQQPEEIPA